MELDAKPFTDVRRSRHEGIGKHGLHGRTARRKAATSDKISFQLQAPTWKRARSGDRRLLTAIEVAGHGDGKSLHKAEAWTIVPEILARDAIGPPKLQRMPDGIDRTTFELQPIVEEIFKKGKPRSQVRQGIYALQRRRGSAAAKPAFVAAPPVAAPAGLVGKALVPRCIGGRTGRHALAALVRNDKPSACFDVEAAGGVGHKKAHLDVDLGADCLISEVSTQGRHPPTRRYPQVRHERREARAAARRSARAFADEAGEAGGAAPAGEDLGGGWVYYVEGQPDWSLSRDGQYPGPWYDVLSLGDARFHRPGAARGRLARWQEQLQWVTRYELLARRDGVHGGWFAVGTFEGNADVTGEVVHSLTAFKGGLVARHLRFVPLEEHGGGALRVALYGEPLAAPAQPAPRAASASSLGAYCAPAADEEGDEEAPTAYVLERRRPNASFTHAPDGQGVSRCNCSYCIAPRTRTGRRRSLWLEAGGAGLQPWKLAGAAKEQAASLAASG